jgi:3-oxoacyl-[acyl-carrier protein] reductase
MNRLANRSALVTGGASGIGKAQALRFGAEGAKVTVADLNDDGARATAEQIVADGGQATSVHIDIADHDSVEKAVAHAIETFGFIDVLSNTAGLFDHYVQLTEADLELFQRVMRVNVEGLFNVTKAVVPHMIERGGGSIVNIASAAGLRGGGGGIAYTTSKHAVIGFTRQMAAAHGSQGIRVNAIAPGLIDTPMVADVVGDPASQSSLTTVPAQRVGEPEDIANAALFLVSDEADYIHGTTLAVDGGLSDTF